MNIYIKNMVCLRCKMFVKKELDKLEVKVSCIELGKITLPDDLEGETLHDFRVALLSAGLEVLDDKKAVLIERIKNTVTEMIHHSDELPKINFSHFLSDEMGLDYNYMASTFSEVQGITIEHYIISHKIERVKELLLYDELSLTEISQLMHYSSLAHLSNQFKKVTGLTPSFFKQLKENKGRVILEDL